MPALAVPINLEDGFKQQFAAYMAQGCTPLMSALRIWPHNNGLAASYAYKWRADPVVLAFLDEAKKVDAPKPPTKEEQALAILRRAESMEDDEYIKAQRLAAELLGNMPKAGDINLTNSIVNNRVMVVKDHGTDDEWETKIQAQQAKLIEHAAD